MFELFILSLLILYIGFRPRIYAYFWRKEIIDSNPENIHLGNAIYRVIVHGEEDKIAKQELHDHLLFKCSKLSKEQEQKRITNNE